MTKEINSPRSLCTALVRYYKRMNPCASPDLIDVPSPPTPELELHLKTGDYFRYLSGIGAFLEETLQGHEGEGHSLGGFTATRVHEIRRELAYLDQFYKITPKQSSPNSSEAC